MNKRRRFKAKRQRAARRWDGISYRVQVDVRADRTLIFGRIRPDTAVRWWTPAV